MNPENRSVRKGVLGAPLGKRKRHPIRSADLGVPYWG
jgi:hypothetical protein